jgi:hypothetical protein
MSLADRPYGPVTGAGSVAGQIALNTQGSAPGPLPALNVLTAVVETLLLNACVPPAALVCALGPDTAALEQTAFDVWLSGYIETTVAGNITLKLYEGAAIVAGNLLGTSGAVAYAGAATAAFYAHAQLIFDSVSGVLAGTVEFYVNKVAVARVTVSNFVGGFRNVGNPSAHPPTVANLPEFCLSVTSSGATADLPTTVNVQKFSCG